MIDFSPGELTGIARSNRVDRVDRRWSGEAVWCGACHRSALRSVRSGLAPDPVSAHHPQACVMGHFERQRSGTSSRNEPLNRSMYFLRRRGSRCARGWRDAVCRRCWRRAGFLAGAPFRDTGRFAGMTSGSDVARSCFPSSKTSGCGDHERRTGTGLLATNNVSNLATAAAAGQTRRLFARFRRQEIGPRKTLRWMAILQSKAR